MLQKFLHSTELLFITLSIHWQPVFGIAMSIAGGLYYLSMLKVNVVDKNHGGSWKKYIKSIFTI